MTFFKRCALLVLPLMAACMHLPAAEDKSFFTEVDADDPEDPWQQSLLIEETIYDGKTPFQKVFIFTHPEFGRVLTLDGIVQTTENDEYIYHEMLNQVPMLAHPNPKRVLIIGGGDGGSLREVLRHKGVEKVTMCDLDKQVVELCKKYLPKISNGAFEDPRAELVIQDGSKFVKETKNKYDVIICDTTDPFGPGEVLFSKEFYADCKKLLNDKGILATQNGVPFYMGDVITKTYDNLSPSFKNVKYFVAPVPTYMGGFMAFGCATDADENCNRSNAELAARLQKLGGRMKYYTPEIHNGSFALPQYVLNYIPQK